MKRIVYILNVLLSICISQVMAQENEVFPTKNAEWKVRCNGYFYYGTNYHVDDYTISLTERDTLCLGKTYTIFTEREHKGGIRVENSKVWCTFNWEHEFLLYDFDVKEGDTIVHGLVYKDYPYFIKESIAEGCSTALVESEIISIVDRVEKEGECKLIHVRREYRPFTVPPGFNISDFTLPLGSNADTWQEGIGSLNGLFLSWATIEAYLVGHNRWQFQTYILKMTQNGEIHYYNPDIPETPEYPEIVYAVDEVYRDQLEVQYDETRRMLSTTYKDSSIEMILSLHDLSGKTLLKIPFKGDREIAIPPDFKGYHFCTVSQSNTIIFSSKIKL